MMPRRRLEGATWHDRFTLLEVTIVRRYAKTNLSNSVLAVPPLRQIPCLALRPSASIQRPPAAGECGHGMHSPCRNAERNARSEEHTSELQSQSNLVCR